MHACVHVRLPDGRVEPLVPGDILGRIWNAAVRFDDPHVSEAHAMVSLRGAELQLLALRRRLQVHGKSVDAVTLEPGLRVHLAPAVELVIESVVVPDEVLGLEGDGLAAQALPGTCSLVRAPHLRLAPGAATNALATFWCSGDTWRARVGDGEAFDLRVGSTLVADGVPLRAVAIPLGDAGPGRTRADLFGGPLRVVAWFDTVHIHRAGASPVALSGQLARIVSELVAVGAPVPWQDVAAVLWPAVDDRDVLRRRWDVLLVRLRDRLRDGGVRPDLVRSSRLGLVELVLQDGDTVEDRT